MSAGASRTPLEVFAELQRCFAAGDGDSIAAVLHDDFEIEQPVSFPHGGRHRGLAGMGEMGLRFSKHGVVGGAQILRDFPRFVRIVIVPGA